MLFKSDGVLFYAESTRQAIWKLQDTQPSLVVGEQTVRFQLNIRTYEDGPVSTADIGPPVCFQFTSEENMIILEGIRDTFRLRYLDMQEERLYTIARMPVSCCFDLLITTWGSLVVSSTSGFVHLYPTGSFEFEENIHANTPVEVADGELMQYDEDREKPVFWKPGQAKPHQTIDPEFKQLIVPYPSGGFISFNNATGNLIRLTSSEDEVSIHKSTKWFASIAGDDSLPIVNNTSSGLSWHYCPAYLAVRCPLLPKSELISLLETSTASKCVLKIFWNYLHTEQLSLVNLTSIEEYSDLINLFFKVGLVDVVKFVQHASQSLLFTLEQQEFQELLSKLRPTSEPHPFFNSVLSALIGSSKITYQEKTILLVDSLMYCPELLKESLMKLAQPASQVEVHNLKTEGLLEEQMDSIVPKWGVPNPHSDFELIIEGSSLQVHSHILAARWPYFARLLKSGLVEAQSKTWHMDKDFEVSKQSSLALVRYLYCAKLSDIEDKAWFEIYKISEDLGLFEHPHLKSLYRHSYKRCRFLPSAGVNPLKLFRECQCENTELRDRARDIVVKNLRDILETQKSDFEALPLDEQTKIMMAAFLAPQD